MLAFESAARTDIGRFRETNQDVCLVRNDLGLFVLSDGMGGHAAGDLAASIAVTTVEALLDPRGQPHPRVELSSPDGAMAALVSAVKRANTRIHVAAAKDRSRHGMGTTIVAALVFEDTLCLAHVGASRIYRLREEQIQQLTDDHTVAAEWVRQGAPPDFANSLAMGRALTRSVGLRPDVDVSMRMEGVQPGDLLVLCSDGVHGMLSSEELTGLLRRPGDLAGTVEKLIARANEVDGQDNSAVILVRWAR